MAYGDLTRKNERRRRYGYEKNTDLMDREYEASQAAARQAVRGQNQQRVDRMHREDELARERAEQGKRDRQKIMDAFSAKLWKGNENKQAKTDADIGRMIVQGLKAAAGIAGNIGGRTKTTNQKTATKESAEAKKRWSAEEAMRERREAAKAAGKGNWNAEEAMRERREAAMAAKGKNQSTGKKSQQSQQSKPSQQQKKGTWNAQEEMARRRAAAQAAGKGNWNAEEEMRKRREAAAARKQGR